MKAYGHRAFVAAGLALILALAAFLRLQAPTRWPLFLDEDQHAVAALQISRHPSIVSGLSKAALETGKPPLLPLLMRVLGPAFGGGVPAGRAVSGFSGVATTLLCFALGARLGSDGLGLGAALLYATSPWAVLHERLAIHDGLLTVVMLATLLLVWEAARLGTWSSALIAAVAAAAAVNVKQSGILVAVLPFLAWSMFRPSRASDAARALLIAASPVGTLLLLSSGSFGGMNASQFPLLQPFNSVALNLRGLTEIAGAYMPLGLGAFVIAGAAMSFFSGRGFAAYLTLALLAWALPWPVAGPFTPSRYYLPALPLACGLAVFAAHGVAGRRRSAPNVTRLAGGFWLLATALLSAQASFAMVTNLGTALLPGVDAYQYQRGWPSGFGLQEACAYVLEHAEAGAQILPVMHSGHAIVAGAITPPRRDVTVLPFPDYWTDVSLSPYSRAVPLYIVVDDWKSGARTGQILGTDRSIVVHRVFPRPGMQSTIFVLRRPAVAGGPGPTASSSKRPASGAVESPR